MSTDNLPELSRLGKSTPDWMSMVEVSDSSSREVALTPILIISASSSTFPPLTTLGPGVKLLSPGALRRSGSREIAGSGFKTAGDPQPSGRAAELKSLIPPTFDTTAAVAS
uniref:Uncharacterized protein n=1 Tax=Bionectria ochroleuca TaxID=29856 RepID=A0A8H7NJ50_BIOOC